MVEFAQHEFRLSTRQKDGATLREHLEAVQRQTGKKPEELCGPELPPEGAHWWHWWCELAQGRQNGLAVSPITWADVAAWAALTGRQLDPFDLNAIRAIDAAFVVSKASKKD